MAADLGEEVSPDLDLLDGLRALHPWLPSNANVRPSAETKARKLFALQAAVQEWQSMSDFILCTALRRPKGKLRGVWYCADREVDENTRVFSRNEFPYESLRCEHWVLWYGCARRTLPSSAISAHIRSELLQLLGNDEFEFIWYENPKMSLPEFYHVHVFWTRVPTRA